MKTKFILVMGVSGCGKTTIGKELATRLGWNFYDGDDFHSTENIAKMRSGVPLTNEDRLPWLDDLHRFILSSIQVDTPGVLACSALKEEYRQILLQGCENVQVVFLKGSYEQILARMSGRSGHYMKPEMLKSQFAALEEPVNALVIEISASVEEIVEEIVKYTAGV